MKNTTKLDQDGTLINLNDRVLIGREDEPCQDRFEGTIIDLEGDDSDSVKVRSTETGNEFFTHRLYVKVWNP